MAVGTGVKTLKKAGPAPKSKHEPKPEPKAEPKSAVVDKSLVSLIKEWDNKKQEAEAYFPRIVQYVYENGLTREALEAALINARDIEPVTAKNEASKIFKAVKITDVRERLIPENDAANYDPDNYSVNDAKQDVTKYQKAKNGDYELKPEDTEDAEGKVSKRLKKVSKFAIEEAEMDQEDFTKSAKLAYRFVHQQVAKAQQAEEGGNGETEGEEEEDEG